MTTTKQYFKVKNGLEFPIQDALTVTDNGGPSVKPSLLLDFSNSEKIDSRITFTRNSTASVYSGRFVKSDENIVTYSQDFSVSNWSKTGVTVSANYTTAPDNSVTANYIVETSATSEHTLTQYVNFQPGWNTYSYYAKWTGGGRPRTKAVFNVSPAGAYAIFDVKNGFVAVDATVQGTGFTSAKAAMIPVGKGWYRCVLSVYMTIAYTGTVYIAISDADNSSTYAGNSSWGLYAWGAQLEAREYPTSYNLTTSQPINKTIMALDTVASSVPRIEIDPVTEEVRGLLMEEPRTNIMYSSSNFSVANAQSGYWVDFNGAKFYDNVTIAPDGTLTAAALVGNPSAGPESLFRSYKILTFTSGSNYTFSFYTKQGTSSSIGLMFINVGGDVAFNYSTGTFSGNGNGFWTNLKAENVGSGWWRISATGTANIVYAGPGLYVGGAGQTAFVWGFQIEAGNFATSYIPTPVTFTSRRGTATYRDVNGNINIADNGVLRYEYNKLGGYQPLIEVSSTNNAAASENFSNDSYWLKQNTIIVPNCETAPDGSYTASRLVPISTGTYRALRNIPQNALSGLYNFSIFAKAGGGYDILQFLAPDGATLGATFDLVNGTATTSITNNYVTITPYANGWYRCTYTTTNGYIYIFPADSVGTATATQPDGYAKGIYIWGAQWEALNVPTSYIPTIGTFVSRSSKATYYDQLGNIRTALENTPRYSYNVASPFAPPKLVTEKQSTNLFIWSDDCWSNWTGLSGGGAGAKVTGTYTTAPDGTSLAYKFYSSNACSTWSQSVSSLQTYTVYCVSWYAKAGSSDGFRPYQPWVLTSNSSQTLNPGLQEIYVGNGWYRQYFLVNTLTNTGGYFGVHLTCGTTQWAYLWGFQIEAGYFPTSYISSGATQTSRAADSITYSTATRYADNFTAPTITRATENAYLTGNNFLSWFRQDEGTILAEAKNIFPVTANRESALVSIYGNLSSDSNLTASAIRLYHRETQGSINFIQSGGADVILNSSVHGGSAFNKIAATFKQNDFAMSINGGTALTDTTNVTPTDKTYFGIGCEPWALSFSGLPWNGHIKKIAFVPKRLNNVELQSLSS